MTRILLAFLFLPIALYGQDSFRIKGQVHSKTGNLLPSVSVSLNKGDKSTTTNENGAFEISNVKAGAYIISLSAVGFNTIQSNITVDKNVALVFTLEESSRTLDSIKVVGKDRATLRSEQAITISSLDVKKLADRPLGAEEVLKTSTGLVVRQSGGLGSSLNINLNGLTGEAVRIYYDDIPIQTYGYGIQLNNIPVDALQRIDVYKGVMPLMLEPMHWAAASTSFL